MEPKKASKKLLSMISLLLGIAAVASSLAYFLYRGYTKRVHDAKWRDYENCGI